REKPLELFTWASSLADAVRFRVLIFSGVLVSNPEMVKHVLVDNASNYWKGRALIMMKAVVGNGLLTSEGDFWRRQRRLAQPAFHRERISAYGKMMVRDAEQMMATWQTGETRDIHRDMMRLTMEIVTHTLFNVDVADDAEKVAKALAVLVEPFGSQATLKWILDNRLPTSGNRRFHKTAAQLDEVIYRIIAQRRASDSVDQGDLLSMLLQA